MNIGDQCTHFHFGILQVIVTLVQHYVDLVAMHIPEYITELETVSEWNLLYILQNDT